MAINLLKLIQEKLKINSYDELNEAEREYIRNLEKILAESKITDEKVKEWLKVQISLIEDDLCNPDNSYKKDIYLKARLRNFKMLLNYLESEKKVEEEIVKQLK
jgi:hypothetical protein